MQFHVSESDFSTLKLRSTAPCFGQSFGTADGGQQGAPSSAGDEQAVQRQLARGPVQTSPRRQNLTGGQFVIERIEHLQDVSFSCGATGQR